MSDYQPQPGHRVRVVFEGIVHPDGDVFLTPSGVSRTFRDAVSVERLPADPEPEWQPGDVITTRSGSLNHTLLRTTNGRWHCTCSTGDEPAYWVTRRWEAGQVTPVLRDGKPWGES